MKPKGRGGPGRGQGRKRGSTRPENRIGIAESYLVAIQQLRDLAAHEGCTCNPVTETYMLAYAINHPDKVTIYNGQSAVDILDAIICDETLVSISEAIKVADGYEEHFLRYCETQAKLRRRGERESRVRLKQVEALERRRR
jgi:hypothetical protein